MSEVVDVEITEICGRTDPTPRTLNPDKVLSRNVADANKRLTNYMRNARQNTGRCCQSMRFATKLGWQCLGRAGRPCKGSGATSLVLVRLARDRPEFVTPFGWA